MRINHNITAMNTYRQLSTNTDNQSKSIEKLSSGLRINRAGDDAAGLAISEKMRGQIRGLDQASRNAQDGISLIQTAEGALSETHDILQRMRELSVQGANDTNTTDDRSAMQSEVTQLSAEIDRIGNTTQFNTKNLLNGGSGLQTNFTAMTVAGVNSTWMSVTGGDANTASTGAISITGATAATGATSGALTVATTVGAKSVTINGTTLNYTATGTAATDAKTLGDLINANKDKLGATATYSATTLTITNSQVGTASKLTISALADALTAANVATTTTGTDATITEATISTNYIANGNNITVTGGNYKGMTLSFNGSAMSTTAGSNAATGTITGNGSLALQIGANQGQNMSISIGDMRASALGVSAIDVSTTSGSSSAITTIDNAIRAVSAQRSNLGAYQNRLDHTINNLNASSENMSAAESRIRDVDMAKEMMEQSKNSILAQASQAMLAQANQQPQGVLQLLR